LTIGTNSFVYNVYKLSTGDRPSPIMETVEPEFEPLIEAVSADLSRLSLHFLAGVASFATNALMHCYT